MLHRTCALIVLLATGICAAAEDRLENRNWKLVTTENFRVHSVLTEVRTIELLRQLEAMRTALGDIESEATYRAAVPTVIFALDKESDYLSLGVPEGTVGYFIADLRENAIVVLDNDDVQGIQTILHEYVHYLSYQLGRINLPRWYEEGTAEYLSSSQLLESIFEYGLPLKRRIAALTFYAGLPLSQVLNVRNIDELDDVQTDLFYSQAWLLMHYFNSLPNGERRIEEGLTTYSELIVSGSERVDAFEDAFSTSVATLEDELSKYLLAGVFQTRSVAMDTSMPGFSPRVTSITKSEVQVALGRMAMRFGNDQAAEQWFTEALSNMDTQANAEAGLGTVLGSRGQVAEAEARFEAAIYLVSYDFRMWMDYAQFWAERVSEATDFTRRTFYAKRLEEALNNALTISSATPELNYLMGFSLLTQGKDTEEAIEFLIEAGEESPADQNSRLLLANAYLYTNRAHLAIGVAESVLSLEHDANEVTTAARDIIVQANQLLEHAR